MEITRSNRTIILYVVVFTSFINPFLSAAINIALPDIAKDFSMNAIMLSWVAMSFLLSTAVFLVPFGKLSDLFGLKDIFIWGNVIITITSFLCGIAGSGSMLITMRVIQGLGGAMMFATGMAIITNIFPANERGKAIGINVAAVYLGLSVAPVAGGFLTQEWGWRSIFLVLLPFELIIIILSMLYMPRDRKRSSLRNFDFTGTLIYMTAISALILGFSKLPQMNAVLLTTAGIILLGLFVYIELRREFPVMEIKLFRDNRVFAFSNLSAFINYATTFAISFILSLFLQYVKGLSPRETGMLLISQPILMTIVSTFAGRLSDRRDPRMISSLGMAVTVIGLLMLAFISETTSNLYLIVSLVILGTGFGLFSSPNTNAIMGSVNKQNFGIASATLGTMRLTGQMMSLGLATLMINLFIGTAKINAGNHLAFVQSARLLFALFAVLCFFGIFASLARGKKEN